MHYLMKELQSPSIISLSTMLSLTQNNAPHQILFCRTWKHKNGVVLSRIPTLESKMPTEIEVGEKLSQETNTYSRAYNIWLHVKSINKRLHTGLFNHRSNHFHLRNIKEKSFPLKNMSRIVLLEVSCFLGTSYETLKK